MISGALEGWFWRLDIGRGTARVQPTVIAPRVQAAAISPDGRYLATTATDEGHAKIILHELRVERNLSGDQTILHEADAYFDDLLYIQGPMSAMSVSPLASDFVASA